MRLLQMQSKMICHTPYFYISKLSKLMLHSPKRCPFGAILKVKNSFPNFFDVKNGGLQLEVNVFLPGTHIRWVVWNAQDILL